MTESGVVVLDDYVGAGYARTSEAGLAAIRTLAMSEGIALDPVYTGKAMAGLLDLLQMGSLDGGQDIVFLHTGGDSALFAYPEAFQG